MNKPDAKEYHVLNLGAGVQSTTLYLMIMRCELDIPLDCAVFSDLGEEPASVYRHLDYLIGLAGPKIHVVKRHGELRLGDALLQRNTLGARFASIPAFTAASEGETRTKGMARRQCTREWKVEAVAQFIRRGLIGLKPGERIPKHITVHQYFGFSFDEPGRAARTRIRYQQSVAWGEPHFPLYEEMMTRADCVRYLEALLPHPVPRSACVFCPYKSNYEWRQLKQHDPAGWARACEVDEGMRAAESIVNRGPNHRLYVHSSCIPLSRAPLDEDQRNLFEMECEGGCGL